MTAMLRTGLRNDDVNALTRVVRAGRDAGLGPDEAWNKATKEVHGVQPEVLEAWREEVEKRAEGGIAQQLAATRTANVVERLQEQDEEIAALKRLLSDAGAQYEQLQKECGKLREQLAAAEELLGEKGKKVKKERE